MSGGVPSSFAWVKRFSLIGSFLALSALLARPAFGQADQGTITGVVQDSSGGVVASAKVTLTNTDTQLVLQTATDASGVYTFSPIKIGNYKISVTLPGFATTTQENLHVSVQQRLSANLQLKAGSVTDVIEVTSEPPLMQAEEASAGQVMLTKVINDTPLNGRNWVYIAQLTAGTTPSHGSRGGGKGDFEANGQRAEQNNFILDGVDNNNNVVDFLNGASFIVRPPPDALAEFKVQTADYSAEFGHSAGAVVNASLKSGTNLIHGDLWEYFRNNALDAKDWNALTIPKYRENQFGATLGFPILKNRLFFFGDLEANRIIFGETSRLTVPTAKMRSGDFTELLDPNLNGTKTHQINLYEPGSDDVTKPLGSTCGNPQNVMCASEIDSVAQKILNMYPLPNANAGRTFNNAIVQRNSLDNTWQFDTRTDWNVSSKDQTFARFSYLNEPGFRPGPLGPVLDGGGFSDDGQFLDRGENFVLSETHLFTNTLTNEFRFGYNWAHFGFFQQNINSNVAAAIGLGGIPFGPLNGGLPNVSIGGISSFGSPTFYVSNEYENVFQVLDNVSKIAGNHALKFGVNFQHIRFATEQPTQSRGSYGFNGVYTGLRGVQFTGSGVADFLADSMNSAALSNLFNTDDVRWDNGVYAQDDWKITRKLTLNLGLRYEYPQAYRELFGHQAVFYPTGPLSPGNSMGVYAIPEQSKNVALAQKFTNLLATDNISLEYSSNPALIQQDKVNFAPRLGFAYRPRERAVIRGGYGIFYGGVESTGYFPNLGENFPFEFDSNFPAVGACNPNNCPTNGFTLETGFTNSINAGLFNAISTPTLRGSDPKVRTPYGENYNLTVEYAITNNLGATIGYVGSQSHHLQVFPDPNSPLEIQKPGSHTNCTNANTGTCGSPVVRPFPDFGGVAYTAYRGVSNYNSLQAKLERRFSNGLSFLTTYTYAHTLDDAPTPLGSTGDAGYRNPNIVPIRQDYANSPFDVRHRLTFSGNYQLPFGVGQRYAHQAGPLNYLIGGWSSSLVFRAQTGEPFTVGTYGINTPVGAAARGILVGDPFKGGGTPPPSNPTTVCPSQVRTTQNWFNPCAFDNPPAADPITTPLSGAAALAYLGGRRNQIHGPGYQRIDMSLFKDFHTFRERTLQFRTDIFNLLNTPSLGTPGGSLGPTAGLITGPRSFQSLTPDARFFQFALKYTF